MPTVAVTPYTAHGCSRRRDVGNAHGTRHMLVWGYEFCSPDQDDETENRQAAQR